MTAQPNFAATPARCSAAAIEGQPMLTFDLVGPFHQQRRHVEKTIAQRFADVYGASIKHFMPLQLCVSLNQEIVATVGIRRAQQSPLFLEQYFDAPMESFASKVLGRNIARDEIVEIGNLASTWRGASQWLFAVLTLLLCEQQQPWVAFTATPEVQKLLRRLDITPHALTSADADRLGDNKSTWGNYYAQKPLVMITHAPTAKRNLLAHPLMATCMAQLEPFIETLSTQWQTNCEGEHDRAY